MWNIKQKSKNELKKKLIDTDNRMVVNRVKGVNGRANWVKKSNIW